MKNSKLMKAIFVILVGAIVLLTTNYVFAADDDFEDLLNPTGNNTATNNVTNNTTNNTTDVNNTLNELNTSALTNNNNTTYNNTSLPNTGIQDSIPTIILITVFAISAIYAYKKVKDYQNI